MQYTALVLTRIIVTAPDRATARQTIRDLTDQAAEHTETTAPAGDVTVHRSTITNLHEHQPTGAGSVVLAFPGGAS